MLTLLDLFGDNGEHWTKGVEARREDGEGTSWLDPKATSWCLIGGAAKTGFSIQTLYDKITKGLDICWFNDNVEWKDLKERLEVFYAQTIPSNP